MEDLKKNWWKIIVIVLVSLIVDMLFHQIIPANLSVPFAPSVIVEQGWLLPVADIAILMTLGALAVVFVLLQENLPGKKSTKGLWYGISFGGLWLIGFLETSVVWGTPTMNAVSNWLPDCVPIILMLLLLGIFMARDSDPVTDNKVAPVLIVAAFYLVGRYFAYWVVKTNAAYNANPLFVFLWTLVMALWIGIVYAALGPGSRRHSPITRALWFGGLVLGIDWLIYHLFMFFFRDASA
jgi:hypothetical protein